MIPRICKGISPIFEALNDAFSSRIRTEKSYVMLWQGSRSLRRPSTTLISHKKSSCKAFDGRVQSQSSFDYFQFHCGVVFAFGATVRWTNLKEEIYLQSNFDNFMAIPINVDSKITNKRLNANYALFKWAHQKVKWMIQSWIWMNQSTKIGNKFLCGKNWKG